MKDWSTLLLLLLVKVNALVGSYSLGKSTLARGAGLLNCFSLLSHNRGWGFVSPAGGATSTEGGLDNVGQGTHLFL